MSASFFELHGQVNRRRGSSDNAAAEAEKETGAPPLTVSQLTARIDRVLKGGIPESLHVRGQISNFKPHQASGHLYFTLKDPGNCLECVMWKSDASRLKFEPEDGLELIAGGKLGVYGQRGRYQLYVTSLRPLGQGALELAFRQLHARLEADGLFTPERKRPLPKYPTGIVLVTSREAAACHDMLKVLEKFHWLRVMVYPVPVQGEGAGRKIADALGQVNSRAHRIGAQVILLARGGGSLEDLWAFNEECVARAVAASQLPVVTGIGHEVDVSIADLVADYHAHTPTEAAQVVTAAWRTASDELFTRARQLRQSIRAAASDARQRLDSIERHEVFRRPLAKIDGYRQLLDDRQKALALAMGEKTQAGLRSLRESAGRFERWLPARLATLEQRLDRSRADLESRMAARMRRGDGEISHRAATLAEHHPRVRVRLGEQTLEGFAERLKKSIAAGLKARSLQLDAAGRQLESLNPQAVLRRGFTLTRRKKDGAVVRETGQLKAGEKIITRFAEGEIESTVDDPRQPSLF